MARFLGVYFWSAVILCVFGTTGADAAESSEFQEQLAESIRAFEIARSGLSRTVEFTRKQPELFAPDKGRKKALITRQEKLAIWTAWSSILHAQAALDNIRRHWSAAGPFRDKSRRNASLALNHASFLAGYRFALEFIALTDRNPELDIILNEAVPELGIASGSFGRLKFRFLNVAAATEFSALQVIGKSLSGNPPAELRRAMDDDCRVIWRMGAGKGHALTLKNALAVVKNGTFTAWFPVQKNVSAWLGDTKVWRPGNHLITKEQISDMKTRLKPGDILFERHEWYLSNMGLPGFWTHVALYIGTPKERRDYFSDPETKEWVKSQGVTEGDLELLLQQRYPLAYNGAVMPQENGHLPRIIEAISEGVSFTSLERSAAADSIGVLRPTLPKPAIAEALVRAFHYSGRPYDFNFDFRTDATLVCSELVFKAYDPAPGMKGLHFPVTEIMGRPVSTPNNMVRQFDEHDGKGDAPAGFVLFLDGYERERRAVTSGREQFRNSWKRPNWHILIQESPQNLAQGR